MQQTSQPNDDRFLFALDQNTKQLQRLGEQIDRLNERSRDFATRSDLKEMVAQRELEPQLTDLKTQIKRVNDDRIEDKKAWEKRATDLEDDQMSRQDKLWIRFGQIASLVALLIALFEFLSHYRFIP